MAKEKYPLTDYQSWTLIYLRERRLSQVSRRHSRNGYHRYTMLTHHHEAYQVQKWCQEQGLLARLVACYHPTDSRNALEACLEITLKPSADSPSKPKRYRPSKGSRQQVYSVIDKAIEFGVVTVNEHARNYLLQGKIHHYYRCLVVSHPHQKGRTELSFRTRLLRNQPRHWRDGSFGAFHDWCVEEGHGVEVKAGRFNLTLTVTIYWSNRDVPNDPQPRCV